MIRLLATMARNKVVDHARKLSNQGGAADSDLLAAIPDRGRSPSSVVASQEFLQKVQGLLTDEERLLAEERAEGQSWPELAARHGGTAESLRKKVERRSTACASNSVRPRWTVDDLVERIRDQQRLQWQAGRRVSIENYLGEYPQLRADWDATLDLICGEVLLRRELGERPGADEYATRFPEHATPLRRQFELLDILDKTHEPSAPEAPPSLPGYEIVGRLGSGARGVVYRAVQTSVNRAVALKVLRADALDGPGAVAIFRREAEAVARLQHPGIVQVFDYGEHEGRPYFAMELVEGGSLEQKLGGRFLPVQAAAECVETLARAATPPTRRASSTAT